MAGGHSGSRVCMAVAFEESGEGSLSYYPQNCRTVTPTVCLPAARPAEPQLSDLEKGGSLLAEEPRSPPPTLPGGHTQARLVSVPHFGGDTNPEKVQPVAGLALGSHGASRSCAGGMLRPPSPRGGGGGAVSRSGEGTLWSWKAALQPRSPGEASLVPAPPPLCLRSDFLLFLSPSQLRLENSRSPSRTRWTHVRTCKCGHCACARVLCNLSAVPVCLCVCTCAYWCVLRICAPMCLCAYMPVCFCPRTCVRVAGRREEGAR